jgi:hypothetical protein
MALGANDFLTRRSARRTYMRAPRSLVGFAADDSSVDALPDEPLGGGACRRVGSRFWPLSTPSRPKQLLPLVTAGRCRGHGDAAAPSCRRIAPHTHERGVGASVAALLPDVPRSNILASGRRVRRRP